jgi:cytochrome P450
MMPHRPAKLDHPTGGYRCRVLFRNWEGPLGQDWPPVASVELCGTRHVVVTRHALVRRVLADPETFRPDNALDAVTPIPVAALRILARHGFRLPATLANNGTPSHPAIRELVAEALRPDRVAAQRPWLTGVVRRRVTAARAALRRGEQIDLYGVLAADLPLLALARLVALPGDGAATVKEFSRAALELFWAPVDADRQLALAEAVGRYHAVLRSFARKGSLLAAYGEDAAVAALFFLLVAGQETTSQFLTLLLHRLTKEPSIVSGLVDGRLRTGDVVEEGLRHDPPIPTWRRIAGRDTTLDGVDIAKGTPVLLWLAKAGREVVPHPDRFVPGQPGSRRHLAFGAGAHRCIGSQLSRMEAAVVVDEAAPLLRGVEVVRAPRYPDNLSFRIPDALVIRSANGRRPSSRTAAR